MSLSSKASQLFRPFGRLSTTGNPGTFRNPAISLVQTLEDENRTAHSMQVACRLWRGKSRGKPGHTRHIPFCSRLRKAGSVALAVYGLPVEPPYIRDLRNTETSRPSLSPGGPYGED